MQVGGTGPASELPRPIAADAQLQSAAVVTYMLNQNNCDSAAGYLLRTRTRTGRTRTPRPAGWPDSYLDSDSRVRRPAGLGLGLGLPGLLAGRTRTGLVKTGPDS